MVNLRQSISTFRKKGKDGLPSSSPTAKFRKSVMGSSPTGTSNHKRTSSLFKTTGANKDQGDPNDLSSHIGEIKVTVSAEDKSSEIRASHQMLGSLQGFTVEEEEDDTGIVEQDDLARKTDLKLQERREQRRKRQEELQKQLQKKLLHHTSDNTNPSLQDDNFPGSLPLHMGSSEEDVNIKPRVVAGGRKSAAIRNRRTTTTTTTTGELDRSSTNRTSGQSPPGDPSTQQRSPGRRMPRKSRILDTTADPQRTGIRPISLQQQQPKEPSARHVTMMKEKDEEVPLVDRSSREHTRKARSKDDFINGDTNKEVGQVGLQSGLRSRERRKTEMGFGQRNTLRSKERVEVPQPSPGTLSTSRRSAGATRTKDEIRGRQRHSMRPTVKDMPEIMGDLEGSGRSSGLEASQRSTSGGTSGLDGSLRSTGRNNKPKLGSWDEGNDQLGLSVQSEHRTSSARRKRRDKTEGHGMNPLHQSEHGGKGRVVRRSERMSPRASKRKTIALGKIAGTEQTDSPQSETRRLRKESRKQRRESETWRTNRSLDDDLGFAKLKASMEPKEKSNGVRFKDDLKGKSSGQNASGERRKSPKADGKVKAPATPNKKKSPRASPKKVSPKRPSKGKDGNSKGPAIESPPIWDDEYGAKDAPAKKKKAPSWALENADVFDPQMRKSDNKSSPRPRGSALESMEDASESQHDFDYQEDSRNRRPDLDSGDEWLQPVGDNELPAKPVLNKDIGKTDSKDGPEVQRARADQKHQPERAEKPSAEKKQGAIVGENASESGSEYSSSESEESTEIPDEVPVVDNNYSKRVSVLPMHGVSSSEEESEGNSSASESEGESSSEEENAGEVPNVVSVDGSLGDDCDDISSASMNSDGSMDERGESEDEEDDEQPSAYEEQILPSSFRRERSLDAIERDIPPPPSYPPPPTPPGAKTSNEDGKFDHMFSNEISALEGTLQGMGDLAQPTPVHTNIRKHSQVQSSQPMDNKFLLDILSVIAPLSSEQKAMLVSDPVAREKVMVAVAEEEKRNRQQMIRKVEILESKLSTVQKDLEKQQLEAAAHKMQVATQDLVIMDYKSSLETLTQKCQSLEKEKDAMSLKSSEQEEKAYQMKESLEETKQLVKEQQMFMNAQQRQMQTMETKISALQESNSREESKISLQNEKLREIIHIQKDTIMKALGNHEQTDTYDA